MAAIIGIEDKKVEEACSVARKVGFVVPANYNCPGQVAISGEREAVNLAMEEARKLGARRTMELKTSEPFHTEKLKIASEKLKDELDKIEIKNPVKKVIKNIDAKEYSNNDDIREILTKHVISPVRFADSIKYMISQGVDTFIEIGPGKVLSGFIKRIDKKVSVLNIQDMESLQNVLKICNEYV